jgi:hypothetical protein
MKMIRYIAGTLMILSGGLHSIPVIMNPANVQAFGMLGFGVLYLTTGILLLMNQKNGPVLGIVFPAAGMMAGCFLLRAEGLRIPVGILLAFDVAVVICCILLISMKRRK